MASGNYENESVWFTIENEHGEVYLGENKEITSYRDARIATRNLIEQVDSDVFRIIRHSRCWYDTLDRACFIDAAKERER